MEDNYSFINLWTVVLTSAYNRDRNVNDAISDANAALEAMRTAFPSRNSVPASVYAQDTIGTIPPHTLR